MVDFCLLFFQRAFFFGKMFYDLNIRKPEASHEDAALEKTIKTLIEYGYKGIAIVTAADDSIFENSKKEKGKKKGGSSENSQDVIPAPFQLENLKQKFPKIHFYNRLNIILSDFSILHKFQQSKNYKKYDILSVEPTNQAVLKALVNVQDFNIISYNAESRNTLSYTRKLYNQFVSQGVYFELTYSSAITDSSSRRNLLVSSHLYHAVGKSKNVIVSSGTQNSSLIRGPYDVVNFSLLFGLSEAQAKTSISKNCEKLLVQARKRRRGKAIIEMKVSKQLPRQSEIS